MSIHLAPEDEALVVGLIETGPFATSADVIHEALIALDRQIRLNRLSALIQEGEDAYARGDYVEWTPTLMDEIWEEAMEKNRLRLPLDPTVCG